MEITVLNLPEVAVQQSGSFILQGYNSLKLIQKDSVSNFLHKTVALFFLINF